MLQGKDIEMEQLTKKEKNRINSALKQSSLELFDIEQKISSENTGTLLANNMNRCTADIKSN